MSSIFNRKNNYNIFDVIIFIPLISYIFGFYFDENSAGAGGYQGDSSWIRKNIDIFLENNLKDAILHPEFFGNRSPLIYIIHKLFNPFFGNFETYRTSGFIISLIGPIFFYQLLKNKFSNEDKKILFLISSILYLSPYYRTSGFWGLNENYGIISSILSFLFLFKINNEKKLNYINIFLLVLFSSLTVYFDLKLLIVPILCFINIIFSKKDYKIKLFVSAIYFVFALPYFFLIYMWEGLVPLATQAANINTVTSIEDLSKIYQIHLGYSATIIAFYLLPIIFFTDKNIVKKISEMFKTKITYLFLILVIFYIFYNFNYFNFEKYTITEHWVGLGVIHKLVPKITQNVLYQEIITYFFFFFSFLIIIFFNHINKVDFLYLIYFFLISLMLWPLMQEYFDPIIYIFAFSIFKSVHYFKKNNSIFLFTYYFIFLIVANIHYN